MPAKVYSTVDDYKVCALPGTANRTNLRRQLRLGMKTHLIKKMGSYIYIAACGMHLANTSLCTSVPSPRKNNTCDAGDMLSMVMHSN